MSETTVPMKEFLLWSNCDNNCQFCWQKKLAKPEMYLTEDEQLQSIAAVRSEICALPYTDILIVGGEVYAYHSPEVNEALQDLFQCIRDRIDEGLTRFMYANSNLLYENTENLVGLLDIFAGAEDKLRLTTSFDIYGRYATDARKQLFLTNLRYIADNYPQIYPVVNCILTKQMCNYITSGSFNIREFVTSNNLGFINFIPYIPIEQGDEMCPSWQEVTAALVFVESVEPHYLRYYKDQMDFIQDRVLKEYHKDTGLVICTSNYLPCKHNENYTRATDDGSCFVCKLKRTIAPEEHSDNVDDAIRDHIEQGGYTITVGDVASYNVWTRYGQPDVVIYDGRSKEDVDVLGLVRQSGTTRFIAINESDFESEEMDLAIFNALASEEKCAVQIEGEEDFAVFPCLRCAPKGAWIIYGDPHDQCMKYMIAEGPIQNLGDS